MKPATFLDLHDRLCAAARNLTVSKGHGYSGEKDTLENLKAVERLGICDAQRGVLVRLTDKFSRLAHLQGEEAQVKNESRLDTILDIINYSILFWALEEEKNDLP